MGALVSKQTDKEKKRLFCHLELGVVFHPAVSQGLDEGRFEREESWSGGLPPTHHHHII